MQGTAHRAVHARRPGQRCFRTRGGGGGLRSEGLCRKNGLKMAFLLQIVISTVSNFLLDSVWGGGVTGGGVTGDERGG